MQHPMGKLLESAKDGQLGQLGRLDSWIDGPELWCYYLNGALSVASSGLASQLVELS